MGTLDIVNYTNQDLSTASISVGTQPGIMAVSPDRTITVVFDEVGNGLTLVDNKTESPVTGPSLPAPTSSIVVSTDSKTAWFATRNAPVDGQQSGAVQVLDLTTGVLGTQIPVPLAQTLVLSPDGKKMLVLRDQTDQISFIDLTATTPTAVPVGGSALSRPTGAVFSTDGTKAYVVNCGQECGGGVGTEAVSVIDMTTTPPSAGAPVQVHAGSTIFIDSSNNLYVAGTKPGDSNGSLTVLTPNGNTAVAKAPVNIGSGFHKQMALGADNKLFVGATGCPDGANVPGAGCLTIYDTSAATSTPTITTGGAGSVTGMAVVPNSHLVYVVMGGELLTYDTRTSAIFAGPCSNPLGRCFVDIVGQAVDVKIVDQ
jgi:DNA-binding beta-propeller fold protein YncE